MPQDEENEEREDGMPERTEYYELDKNEFSNVSLLLKCIQLYSRSDPQEGVHQLLQQGLIPKISMNIMQLICHISHNNMLTREFLSLIEPKESKFLLNLVEDFFDTALVKGKQEPYQSELFLDSSLSAWPPILWVKALRTLNTLLDNVGREERKKFAVSEEICLLTKELAKTILDVGDYDIQVAIVEALFRLMLKKWRDDLVHNWFEDQDIAKAFREIKDRDFETDTRKFLNELNERLGDKRRVCSVPCKAAYADMNTLNKPPDDKLEEFWIDFNFGSESITFYLENPEGVLWESVRLAKEDVSSYYLQEETGEKVLRILLKNPTAINKKEVTKIKIHFDSQLDILTLLHNVMGNDKMMVLLDKGDDSYSADQPQHTMTASTHVEETEDVLGTDSISDILTSQQSGQSVTTIARTMSPVDATPASENRDTERENSAQASNDVAVVAPTHSTNAEKAPSLNTSALKGSPPKQSAKTIEPSGEEDNNIQAEEMLTLEDDALEKRNRAKGNASKGATESKKDAYEFELSSDPAAHETVSEMKQKVFVPKTYLQRMNLTFVISFTPKSTSYKNHLFSESNQDTPSNGTSEKSWILDSQKKSTPKTADYTRKKPRVRSILKVLPLSSPSSGSDHHAKKLGNSGPYREKAKKRTKPSTTEMRSLAAVQPPRISSTPSSHIRQNALEMADATLPLSSHSSTSNSDVGLSTKYEAASITLPLNDKVSIPKRKLSESLVGPNGKRSKCPERTPRSDVSPTIPFKPRRLFNSIEMEEEAPKGQSSNELKDEAYFTKTLEEIGDSGVIAAFENFTSELKKTFWSRYKEMEAYTQNVLKAPGQNLSDLLSRIHQSRIQSMDSVLDESRRNLDGTI
ncbi:hypothetical protein JRQ81_012428 [Phrynocephalus forsythii]|uniref:Synaptonemal complex protein 2-like n=1 Tax=Phrynocephalus forsythii TaxID=171643 RepID=A0A9Q1B5Q0_9SAUR|nr:hypothetical protein JRQ81_012428 [Phrynocephalus forsythii]